MKLAEWARVNPRRAGAVAEKRSAAVYARVASGDQKKDLDRQLARLVEHATAKGLSIVKSVSEIGSGMNGHRPRLIGPLRDATIGAIVVEHWDRLARFGSEYIEAALQSTGRKVVIVDENERKDSRSGYDRGADELLSAAVRATLCQEQGEEGDGGHRA